MKYILFTLLFAVSTFVDAQTEKQIQDGKKIFALNCKYCHSIGQGKVVGPDLWNVEKKYSEADIIKWIKSSQSDIKNGDETGKRLFEQYDHVIMPDQNLSDAEIKSVIAYIKFTSENPVVTVSTAPQQIPTTTQKKPLYFWIGLILIILLIISVSVLGGVLNTILKVLKVKYFKNIGMKKKFNDSTTQRPEGARAMDASLVTIDLNSFIELIRKEKKWEEGDRNAITVFKTEGMRIVLIGLHKGAEMIKHKAEGIISVQILEGQINFNTDIQSVELGKGQILTLHELIPHSIIAIKETIFLLTLTSSAVK